MKTLSPLSLVCNLLLLSVLSRASGQSLTMAGIQEQVDMLLMREDTAALSDFLDQHDGQTKLYRCLKDLVAEGLVVSERQADKNVAYRLADNPLLGLTEEEAQALLLAVRFGANTVPITMPGWQLERTLRDLCSRQETLRDGDLSCEPDDEGETFLREDGHSAGNAIHQPEGAHLPASAWRCTDL